MNALLWILRHGHCHNTHHRFALDAIELVQTEPGKRLAKLLLRYHRRYLVGSTDPDTRICDYHNQVIHVEEGFWGGATRVAHQWYNRLQRRLETGRYAEAAQAAGILSHYFTDPLQPLHTGTTEREALVHRPMERSIYHSYDAIRQIWDDNELRIVFQLRSGPGWLDEAMKQGAVYAHQKYNLLVSSYRFDEGIADPPAGLDPASRAALAEMFGLAITGWARVIERVAAEIETVMQRPLPNFSVTIPTMTAAFWAPRRRWRGRVLSCLERAKIAALAREYRRKGRLEKHLPHEVDVKRRVIQVHREEIVYQVDRERRRQEKKLAAAAKIAQQVANSKQPATIAIESKSGAVNVLLESQPLHDAPSLTSRTILRFHAIGIRTVGQLISGDPGEISNRLSVDWIDADLVRLWQIQASLMCGIPGLKKIDAQILAGTEFQTAQQIANADPRLIYCEVLRYALTTPGRRYLQEQVAPTPTDVKRWVQNAKSVLVTGKIA